MKKSNLITGIVYTIAGVACLLTALFTESRLGGLLFGFAGAGISPGILMIIKYYYWRTPEKRKRYREMLDDAAIEQHDELKEKLRDKSGRYAYTLGLAAVSLSIVIFSILGSLELVSNSRTIVLFLGGYMIFQIVSGIAIFNHLLKKY